MTPASPLREARVGTQQGVGTQERVELASEHVSIVVLPGFGGRVASLVDRRTGREWLVQGAPPTHDVTGPEAVYDADVAWGWDECLPTVSPCADPSAPADMLRDHGEAWGRPIEARPDGDSLHLGFDVADPAGGDGWSFRRTIRIEDRTVRVDYAVANRGREAVPLLWSMHPLLALEPGSTFHLPGVADALATFAMGREAASLLPHGRPARVGWPEAPLAFGAIHRLDAVQPAGPDQRSAVKLYAGPLEAAIAAVSAPDGSWLGYRWDVATAPFLGLWMSNGAWPDPESGVLQHALEPTTAAADSLEAAIAGGRALIVEPGEWRRWWVTLEVGSPSDDLAAFLATGMEDSNPPALPRVPDDHVSRGDATPWATLTH